jgi:hypothetical protein
MYFKTIPLPSELNQPQTEASLRKASIKETMSLDFKFKAIDIGTDKIFYGLEGKKDLKFTRLKVSFEFFMPKLIVSLSKDPSANYYRIRPGAISIAVIGLLGFAIFAGLVGILRGTTDFAAFSPFLIIIAIYALLFFFELKLTTLRVRRALTKTW